MQEDSLNVNYLMNKNFGGKQHKLRNTTIKDLGPCHHILQVDDTQSMSFDRGSTGSFYLLHGDKRK